MALEHAILVSLAEQSATGYDLARRFDASIANFWPASHQQIYKTLKRMEASGWVRFIELEGEGPTVKKQYQVTAAGKRELKNFAGQGTGMEQVRSDFAVKIRSGADFQALYQDTQHRRAARQERLAKYQASMAKNYPDPGALTDKELGPYLVLHGGILQEQVGIQWCDDILKALESRIR